jgi:PHD/YefM family antitoxin component YafN of YafNO toxin-antitoxin module
MYKIMPTMPITDARNSIASLVANLESSPVVLTQNGREAAILVHPETWNKLVDTFEKWSKVQPSDHPRYLSWAEFEQQLQEAGFSLDTVQKTAQELLANRKTMRQDRSQVVSSKEMKARMAERGVNVGS